MSLPPREPVKIVAKYNGTCKECGGLVIAGDECFFEKQPHARKGELTCTRCMGLGDHGQKS